MSKIKIKLSADGTRVGRNINLINFTFQIIELLNNKAKSVKYVKTLGIAQCDENYNQLESIYDYIMNAIDELKEINTNALSFNLISFYITN